MCREINFCFESTLCILQNESKLKNECVLTRHVKSRKSNKWKSSGQLAGQPGVPISCGQCRHRNAPNSHFTSKKMPQYWFQRNDKNPNILAFWLLTNSHLVAFAYMYMAWHWLIKVHGFHVFLEMSTVSSRFIPGEMWKDVVSWHCPSILKPKKCQDHKHPCTSGQKFELAIESLTACLVNVAKLFDNFTKSLHGTL